MRTVCVRYITLILFALCAVSCRRDPAPEPEPPHASRTVIAYLCGDNNLSAEVDIKIMALRQGMERIGPTTANLIVYADYRDAMPELVRITHEGRTTLKRYAEINSASPDNLRGVLEEIIGRYPADSYGLICFSHASGWLPQGALNDPEGFGRARPAGTRSIFEDSGCEMPLADFAGALILPGGRKFDFIVLEACFMAGVEVAYELKDKTDHIVASAAEMLSDGFVDVYPEGLSLLMQPEPDLRGFAHAYFQVWNAKSGAYRSATVSVINTAHLDGLAAAVGDIYPAAADVDVSFVQHFDRYPYHLFFDLSDAIEKMAQPEQKALFDTALNKVVEYEAATPLFMFGESYSFPIDHHCGLTTYIRQTGFPDLNEYYTTLKWYKRLEGLHN